MTDTGLVGKVPTEVYLTYEDRAKEIASRSVTETQVAIKNAILRFALEARLSGTASPPAVAAGGVMEALNAAREWINAADHDEHCFTNDPNPDACRCVCDKDSVIALIDDVTAALAVGDEGIREGWQPIETAPKDGTYILAFPVLLNVASVVVWEPPAETPPLMLVKGDHVAHDGHWRLPMSQLASPYAPTHWQPLPTPPSRGEGV